jgi:cell wall-associated NlpC family hydrolase
MSRTLQSLFVLVLLGASGCASTGAVPAPFPQPRASGTAPPRGDAVTPPALVGTALSLRGAPYRNGGSDPSGFDCSGFVAYVFAQQGLYLPRTVSEQYEQGHRVAQDAIEPGDLVFFSTVTAGPSHVGIAISADEFVHAPSSSGVVRVETVQAPYWATRLVGIRRVR